ncbi:MAG: adenylate/guanylate cyclase domain-containing protein [Pseudomonadota bacterium]
MAWDDAIGKAARGSAARAWRACIRRAMHHLRKMIAREDRLIAAERSGLRLAIGARTALLSVAFVWFLSWTWNTEVGPSVYGVAILSFLIAIGALQLILIGSGFDRPWLKYLIYGADTAAICAGFALIPLSSVGDVPQHLVFRVYGVHFLLAPIALATLSLSWGLVLATGLVGVAGWWAAFIATTRSVAAPVSWTQLQGSTDPNAYQNLILDPNFIGAGNRIDETAIVLVITGALALAVYRARRVFLSQIAAEEAREAAAATLGRYVPQGVADDLIADGTTLKPQMREGVALVMDIRDFSAFAAEREPEAVIRALNDFLAASETVVREEGGAVISFTGDGLLAAFNALQPLNAPERAAIAAARRLMGVAAKAGFEIRVGAAAGSLATGSVGSADRRAFTVYGDTVNRAARLEELAKTKGERILVDGRIAGAAEGARPLGPVALRGTKGETEVYALSS